MQTHLVTASGKLKNLTASLLCSLLTLMLGGCTQESLIFYPEVLPADFKYTYLEPFEEITLKVEGAALNILLFKADPSRGVVLYLHGNAGSLRTWGEVAREFTTRGYDLLIPDYRGFGKSTGKISNEKQLLDDGLAVYDYAKNSFPDGRIVVYGRSIGTGVATYIARSRHPRMLILESPYFSLVDLAAYHYPYLPKSLIAMFLKYPLHNDRWISEIACPVYLFHGVKDDIVPFNASLRLLPLIKTTHRMIRIEGRGHNDLNDDKEYHIKLTEILAP